MVKRIPLIFKFDKKKRNSKSIELKIGEKYKNKTKKILSSEYFISIDRVEEDGVLYFKSAKFVRRTRYNTYSTPINTSGSTLHNVNDSKLLKDLRHNVHQPSSMDIANLNYFRSKTVKRFVPEKITYTIGDSIDIASIVGGIFNAKEIYESWLNGNRSLNVVRSDYDSSCNNFKYKYSFNGDDSQYAYWLSEDKPLAISKIINQLGGFNEPIIEPEKYIDVPNESYSIDKALSFGLCTVDEVETITDEELEERQVRILNKKLDSIDKLTSKYINTKWEGAWE